MSLIHSVREGFDYEIIKSSLKMGFYRLSPNYIKRNPLMFLIWIIAVMTVISSIYSYFILNKMDKNELIFAVVVSLSIWFVLYFSYFAESIAELRGTKTIKKIKNTRTEITARKIVGSHHEFISSNNLKIGDLVIVTAGEFIPCDGDVVDGIAIVDESAITGESLAIVKESLPGKNKVIFGTKIVSDSIVVKVTNIFSDNYIKTLQETVDNNLRRMSPNEQALNYLLFGFTLLYVVMCISLFPMASYLGLKIDLIQMAALLICVSPTTAAALINPSSISAIERLIKRNIFILNSKVLEASGDLDFVIFDKTGTITSGNRVATEIIPLQGYSDKEIASFLELCSYKDITVEGKSIYALVEQKFGLKHSPEIKKKLRFHPFTAKTRTSGVEYEKSVLLKGAVDTIVSLSKSKGNEIPEQFYEIVRKIGNEGATPLAVMKNYEIVGIIKLNDKLKVGVRQRLERLSAMGIRVIMLSGDNFYTTKAIANEVGIEDFICEAEPDAKLKNILDLQEAGNIVAFVGDGANDAEALAQSDVGLTLNSSSEIVKSASNAIDRDNDPMKIIDLIEVGRELLITRGCLTTFSFFNDIAKFFVVVPMTFLALYPELNNLNFLNLHSTKSALMAAIIFNALLIFIALPIAIYGIRYRPMKPSKIVRRFFLIFGTLGFFLPLLGIKFLDIIIHMLGGLL